MIGALLGDIAGSRFEFSNNRVKPEELFKDDCFMTDDSYMTAAVFMALLFRNEELGLIDLFLHNMIVSVFIAPDAG